MPPASADALIVGAGVAGLTTALTLAEAGLRVRVWAADPPLATTSAAAGAMWAPYPSEPADRTLRWRTHSLDVLRRLAAQPRTGVRLATGIEAARTPISADVGDPASREFRVCESHELPSGFVAGFRITTPLIDMPVYLRHLERMLADAGTVIEPRRLQSLSQAAGAAATIVNCPVTACTVQGMARVRSGQAPAWPLSSDRSVRRGSGIKHDFVCTFTRYFPPVLVALWAQSCLMLEGRTRTLSGPSPDLSPAMIPARSACMRTAHIPPAWIGLPCPRRTVGVVVTRGLASSGGSEFRDGAREHIDPRFPCALFAQWSEARADLF